ncbi:biotin/lipoyl-binding protein [Chloroflexales bacterium ZM16-3]|nr:biotin/lipoyl-binding protein [Chloroflexales bacterium ZM16-3]
MKRVMVLSIFLVVLLLTACSSKTPTVSSTPAAVESPTAGNAPTATPADTAKTYTVQRGTIEDIFIFNGTISPAQFTVSSSQDGIVQKIFVIPGQSVKEGDVIAQLDFEDLQAQLDSAKLSTEQSQRVIDQSAQAGQLEVQQSQIALDAAQQDLAQTKEPPTAVVLAQAQTAVRQAQANLDTVKNNASQAKNQAKAEMDKAVADLQSIQQQYGEAVAKLKKARGQDAADLETQVKDLETQMRAAEAAISLAVINYDTARNNEAAAVSDAQATFDLAKAQLDDLLKGPDKFVIAEKERAVRSAELAVSQARQKTATDPALQSAVEAGRLQIKQIEDQIAARQIIAPISGELMSMIALTGDTVQVGSPVVILGDSSRLDLVANGAEMLTGGRTTMPTLSMSQAVEITFSRYPGKTFTGTISQLPQLATETTDATNTYHFAFDTQGLTFASGDQAELKIVLQRKDNVLYLPPEAVNASQYRSSVTQRVDGSDTSVDVQIGITTPDKIEITGGLSEGDVVVVK